MSQRFGMEEGNHETHEMTRKGLTAERPKSAETQPGKVVRGRLEAEEMKNSGYDTHGRRVRILTARQTQRCLRSVWPRDWSGAGPMGAYTRQFRAVLAVGLWMGPGAGGWVGCGVGMVNG